MTKEEHAKFMEQKMKQFLKKKKIKKCPTQPYESEIKFDEKGRRDLGNGCYMKATKHSSTEQG